MSVSVINNHTAASASAALEYADPADFQRSHGAKSQPSPADIKKAAAQFEAIIMRQLLAPSIEPIMAGGLGGAGGTGGSMYGYLLTDTLADSLAQGGGLGLARMLEKQFSSASVSPAIAAPKPFKPTTSAHPLP